jgi:hypothetical protein
MTLHFDWLHVPRWLAHAQASRAVSLVLGVIGVSLLFGALRVVDAAISGALIERHPAVATPAASGASLPDRLIVADPTGAGAAIDTSTPVDVPEATAEAVSL